MQSLKTFQAKSFSLRIAGIGLGMLLLVFLFESPVSADSISEGLLADINALWILLAALLVFLMQLGFGFLEAGLTRAKNVANIMAKNIADMAVGTVAFLVVGYALSYGTDAGNLIGTDKFFLSGSGSGEYLDFLFQVVFAATAVTIASGAMAERTKFVGYVIFSAVMTAFIYPVVVHSSPWSDGGIIASLEINGAKFNDFAGSSIVHSTGGWAALMGALLLGPRLGRFKGKTPIAIPGHNIAFTVAGVFLLWFGWFGFNGGSQLAFDAVVIDVVLMTLISGALGGIAAAVTMSFKTGAIEVAMVGNGILAGLVGITAGPNVVNPLAAAIIGAVAGVLVVYSIFFIDNLQIDDPVGAISVHGVCGVWGTLAVGLFASKEGVTGLFYGGGGSLLLVQFIGVLMIFFWVATTSGALFMILRKLKLLRVSREEEMLGLDITEHGTRGYGTDAGGDETTEDDVTLATVLRSIIRRGPPNS